MKILKAVSDHFAFQRRIQSAIYKALIDLKHQNAEIIAELKTANHSYPLEILPPMTAAELDLDQEQEAALKEIIKKGNADGFSN